MFLYSLETQRLKSYEPSYLNNNKYEYTNQNVSGNQTINAVRCSAGAGTSTRLQ